MVAQASEFKLKRALLRLNSFLIAFRAQSGFRFDSGGNPLPREAYGLRLGCSKGRAPLRPAKPPRSSFAQACRGAACPGARVDPYSWKMPHRAKLRLGKQIRA